ncbi:carbohydrate ABC transporter membrane protein 2, CUT1 family [Leifsonia sp. 98AMF]|uniref:carbohydrate ABC transporter permease n=1 Tax=Microbacteriaceae TaxID=85023 RepID=UPI00036C63CB|nr:MULTISPECIES: carbohydrate ABC transporter permease [Microbacteriaceae]TDP98913.1 carbohydrate ABC transporter membrane protein 2 (CUT1 family) [Leifsonia sp. 115AMFTsu3.1]SDH63768.1 carbohydrate ABC transporter membrane protein 2, CUT1 family [Leifsonia sp. 197AMF]SDI75622.1 carbohydrate ABC transporter membrane protein 2, CUT1 family [Leifsonia sp. 466MF]SDK11947.1 carbohydrate ABC transporter membrane protein 2, CUT1 family [Leifsonia sp. 157MF]SDN78824.1 carbohydrate ABC transporter mem
MKRATRNSILIHLAALVVAVVILLPFGWMVIASVTPQRILISTPLQWIPDTLDWSRYELIFRGGAESVGATFRAALANTTIVAVGTVAVSMIVGILGAYAFARLRFRFRQAVLILFLATYMLPQIALLIPLYLILNSLGLLDSVIGLIIVDCSLVVPFVLWILSNYFLTIPEELEEAARIDGASRLGALFRVVLPAARPGIFAAIMFAFLLAWDEFMYALIFTSSNAAKTLPVAISEFAGRYTTDFGLVAAGGILAALPPIVVALIFQRYVVSGMAAGAVKG